MRSSPIRLLDVRRNRPFTWLWWSQTVSLFGSQVSLVAIPLLALTSLSATAFEMGLLVAFEMSSYLVVSLPAGILADRVDRRRLLIVSNLGRAVLLSAIPLAAAFAGLSLPLLYGVAVGVGIFSALFDVTYQSYVPELLAPSELLRGNQRIELSESAARTVGPGLAGGLIAIFGGTVAVIVDAASYLVASVALLRASRVHGARQHPLEQRKVAAQPTFGAGSNTVADGDRAHDKGSMWAGFRIVLLDRALRDMAISTGIFNLASSAIVAVFLLFAARDLGMDPASIGLLLAFSNVGFVVGALAVGRVTTRLGMGWTLTLSGTMGAIATVLLPFATGPAALAFLFAGRFVGAMAIPLFNVNARAFRQSRSPIAVLGRVNAVFRLVDWGTLPIGALLGGWIGTVYGIRATLAIGGVLGIASAAWLIASPLRHVRGLGGGFADAEPGASSAPSKDRRAPDLVHGIGSSVAGRLSGLGQMPLHWTSLAIGGFALQLALFLPPVSVFGAATPTLFVISGAAVLACVIRNVRIPGFAIIALGGASNLLAIVLNGGFMPVSPDAARAVGFLPPTGYVTTIEMTDPLIRPLTDIIVVQWPAPLRNVYSVGDLLITFGLTFTVAASLRRSGRSKPYAGSNAARTSAEASALASSSSSS